MVEKVYNQHIDTKPTAMCGYQPLISQLRPRPPNPAYQHCLKYTRLSPMFFSKCEEGRYTLEKYRYIGSTMQCTYVIGVENMVSYPWSVAQ